VVLLGARTTSARTGSSLVEPVDLRDSARRRGPVAAPTSLPAAVLRAGPVAAVVAVVLTGALHLLADPARLRVEAVLATLAVLVGTPHGALDQLLLAPLGGRLRRAAWFAGYLGLAVAALLAYLAAPVAGFAAFLALSVVHFAAGEAAVTVERGLARSALSPTALVAALGGAVAVLVPLSAPGARSAVAQVDPRLVAALGPVPGLALAAGVLLVVGAGWLLVRGGAQVLTRAAAVPVVVEVGVLLGAVVLADPLLAFAAYFAAWHAARHQARLAIRHPAAGALLAAGHPWRALLRSALPALPATAGAAALAVLVAVAGASALGAALAVVWALTVPHAVSVLTADRRLLPRHR
jgi:Brp/Blh family beta-carotene 15,15'-monooxygenase